MVHTLWHLGFISVIAIRNQSWWTGRTIWDSEIKPSFPSCKAITLPTVQSLWPPVEFLCWSQLIRRLFVVTLIIKILWGNHSFLIDKYNTKLCNHYRWKLGGNIEFKNCCMMVNNLSFKNFLQWHWHSCSLSGPWQYFYFLIDSKYIEKNLMDWHVEEMIIIFIYDYLYLWLSWY